MEQNSKTKIIITLIKISVIINLVGVFCGIMITVFQRPILSAFSLSLDASSNFIFPATTLTYGIIRLLVHIVLAKIIIGQLRSDKTNKSAEIAGIIVAILFPIMFQIVNAVTRIALTQNGPIFMAHYSTVNSVVSMANSVGGSAFSLFVIASAISLYYKRYVLVRNDSTTIPNPTL